MTVETTKTKYDTVMLIDDNGIDNFTSRIIIEDSLFAKNINVHFSGRTALDYLGSIKHTEGTENPPLTPEFIFVDINMPVMNGFQFLDEFEKLDESIKKSIKVVMLSSSKNQPDIDKAMQYNSIYKYLVKPLSETSLSTL